MCVNCEEDGAAEAGRGGFSSMDVSNGSNRRCLLMRGEICADVSGVAEAPSSLCICTDSFVVAFIGFLGAVLGLGLLGLLGADRMETRGIRTFCALSWLTVFHIS